MMSPGLIHFFTSKKKILTTVPVRPKVGTEPLRSCLAWDQAAVTPSRQDLIDNEPTFAMQSRPQDGSHIWIPFRPSTKSFWQKCLGIFRSFLSPFAAQEAFWDGVYCAAEPLLQVSNLFFLPHSWLISRTLWKICIICCRYQKVKTTFWFPSCNSLTSQPSSLQWRPKCHRWRAFHKGVRRHQRVVLLI